MESACSWPIISSGVCLVIIRSSSCLTASISSLLPLISALGLGLTDDDAEALGLWDWLALAEGLCDSDGDGLMELDGLAESDALADGDIEALAEAEGLVLALIELEGLTELLALADGEVLAEAELLGLRLADGETEADGDDPSWSMSLSPSSFKR